MIGKCDSRVNLTNKFCFAFCFCENRKKNFDLCFIVMICVESTRWSQKLKKKNFETLLIELYFFSHQ